MIKLSTTVAALALVLAIHPGCTSPIPIDIKDCVKPLPAGYAEPLFSGLGDATKDSEAAERVRAVRLLAGGGTYLSPVLDGRDGLSGGEGS